MNADRQTRNNDFALGMLAGTMVGAGLILWLAPRAAGEVKRRIADSAKVVGERASEQYQEVGGRLGAALEGFAAKGRSVRDDLADTVARGAHEVERLATTAKAGPSAREL